MAARRRPIAVFAVLLALPLSAFLLLRWALEPERLGALLLERVSGETGLRLATAQPAALGLWPRMQLELVGLTASDGDSRLLSAERIDVALPLSVLWAGDAPDIGRLHLSAPRIDIDAVAAWLQQRPDSADRTHWQLPAYAFELSIERGTVSAADWQLGLRELSASPLTHSVPFEARIDGELQRAGSAAAPLQLTLLATPRNDDGAIVLDALQLVLGTALVSEAVSIDGSARITSSEHIEFGLRLEFAPEWPGEWPALPDTAAYLLPGSVFQLDLGAGMSGAPRLSVASREPHMVMSMTANSADLLDWWRAGDLYSLPPMTGTLDLERWSHGAIGIEGLQVELRQAPQPAAEVESGSEVEVEESP